MRRLRFDCALIPLCVGMAALPLGGCVDTVGQAQIEPAAKIAPREGVSPAGARVAVAGVDGAPRQTAEKFAAALAPAAAARDIATAETGKADYLLRFYLSAAPAGPAARLAYVFDMFDRDRRRTARLSGDIAAGGAGADPWAVDETTLRLLADRAADDMAAALSNTPEAIAAAAGGSTSVARSAPEARPAPRMGLAAVQ